MINVPLAPMEILAGYTVIAVVVVAATWALRWYARAGRHPDARASVLELAYVAGGPSLACHVAVAGLVRAGTVRVRPLSTLVAVGRLPADVAPLMAALHDSLQERQSWSEARGSVEVIRAVNAMDRRLVGRGWLLSANRQRWLRLAGIPGWIVVAAGVVLIGTTVADFSAAGRAMLVVQLICVTGVAAMAHWHLGHVPDSTRAAARALRQARIADRSDTRDGENLRTPEVMRRVALRGPRALLAVDPQVCPVLDIFVEGRKSKFPSFFSEREKGYNYHHFL